MNSLILKIRITTTRTVLQNCKSWHGLPKRSNSQYSVEPATEFFQLSSGDKIAYKKTTGSKQPGVLFMPGLLANMTGEKARILEKYCSLYDYPFIRFDYRGIGESSGDRQSFTPLDWLSDALTVLDTLTNPGEPQVIVGSSMGALLTLHVAMKRPEKVHGVVGIALPFDYPSRMASLMTDEMKTLLKEGGSLPSGRGDFVYKKSFIDAGLKLGFDHENKIKISCPVRLLHGVKDEEVPWDLSPKLMSLVDSEDVQVTLSKSANHRFSRPQDLQVLVNAVDQLLKQHECS